MHPLRTKGHPSFSALSPTWCDRRTELPSTGRCAIVSARSAERPWARSGVSARRWPDRALECRCSIELAVPSRGRRGWRHWQRRHCRVEEHSALTCAECQQRIQALDDLGMCILCLRTFCSRHVFVRGGVANCAACERTRRRREEDGPISQAETARVARLLEQDIVGTIGPGQNSVVEEAVTRIRLFAEDPADFEQRVVDDVQQYLHDTFVDTSWPACPEHPNHPLWFSEGWWICEQSGLRAARLGGLRP